MSGEELLRKMDLVEPSYIQAAEEVPFRRPAARPKVLAACLSGFVLLAAMVTTVYAGGYLEQLGAYFRGDAELHWEEILMPEGNAVTKNGETFRIDGAIADSHVCHILASYQGKGEEPFPIIPGEENIFDLWVKTKDGEILKDVHWGYGVFSYKNGLFQRKYSQLADADVTYTIECYTDMEQVEEIQLVWEDTLLSVPLAGRILPEYPLVPEEETMVMNPTISKLGLYYELPASMDGQTSGWFRPEDHILIFPDGRLYQDNQEFGLSGSVSYNRGEPIPYIGSWKYRGENQAMSTIGLVDLSRFWGVQIHGVNYKIQQEP